MDSQQSHSTIPTAPQGLSALPRIVWVIGGALLVAIAGLASALVMRSNNSEQSGQPEAAMQQQQQPGKAGAVATAEPGHKAKSHNAGGGSANVPTTQVANACPNCGTVEGVQAVQQKGQGTGVGAVAGGVLGGVLGNQMGGGNGKTAMTVLGAVGGGLAGNEVEKRARATTVYNVRVRMDDGSLRTMTLSHAPAPGERVAVEGQSLRVIGTSQGAATQDAPRNYNTKGTGA